MRLLKQRKALISINIYFRVYYKATAGGNLNDLDCGEYMHSLKNGREVYLMEKRENCFLFIG